MRFLNEPPDSLWTRLTYIQVWYKRKGHQLDEAIDSILERNARIRREYEKLQLSSSNDLCTWEQAEWIDQLLGCLNWCGVRRFRENALKEQYFSYIATN